MSTHELSQNFLLQLAIIVIVVRIFARLARKVDQPVVIAEIIAGILLGPSVLGILMPVWQSRLFPGESIEVIFVLGQVGLVIYMFLAGAEFNLDSMSERPASAISISVSGIVVPFGLGAGLALALRDDPRLFVPGVTKAEAAVFLGAAMSITALPVLTRILKDRGMAGSRLGSLALGAAVIDDAVAWCLLALVLASLSGDGSSAALTFGGGVLFVGLMLTVGRWLFRRLASRNDAQSIRGPLLHSVFWLLMLSALFTDLIGIHAIFGAFVLGLAMPRGLVSRDQERNREPLLNYLLLPLFFVYSGLNTRLGLVALEPRMWTIGLAILLIACIGKGLGCWAAARLSGEPNREAMGIGALMNARGLTELILLNIGLERGILQPAMFAMMVVMALVTTLMATPLLKAFYERPRQPALGPGAAPELLSIETA